LLDEAGVGFWRTIVGSAAVIVASTQSPVDKIPEFNLRAREHDRGRETVRTGADDDCIWRGHGHQSIPTPKIFSNSG